MAIKNVFEAAMYMGFLSVLRPDEESRYRAICRWYSKTFHTPLNDVYDLPEEEVLQTYYEDNFDAMEEQEVRQELLKVLEDPEVKSRKMQEEDAVEAQEYLYMKEAEVYNAQKAKVNLEKEKTPATLIAKPSIKEAILPKANPLEELKMVFTKDDNLFPEDSLGDDLPFEDEP